MSRQPPRHQVDTELAELFAACVAAGLYDEDDRPIVAAMAATDGEATRTIVAEMRSRIGGCTACRHFARPGLADGYFSARTELLHVYGFMHELPADRGAWCQSFEERH
jgi:hypothetical protein